MISCYLRNIKIYKQQKGIANKNNNNNNNLIV